MGTGFVYLRNIAFLPLDAALRKKITSETLTVKGLVKDYPFGIVIHRPFKKILRIISATYMP